MYIYIYIGVRERQQGRLHGVYPRRPSLGALRVGRERLEHRVNPPG